MASAENNSNGYACHEEEMEEEDAENQLVAVFQPLKDHNINGSGTDTEQFLTTIIAKFEHHLTERAHHHLGYSINHNCGHYGALSSLLCYNINNAGDPFKESNLGLHSRKFELGVLNWFAQLWHIQKQECWGYVTNGGTEGNLQGILIGRELHGDGILYTSRESHYSIFKAARMFKMDCKVISSLSNGEIDCTHFKQNLCLNKDKPAIINLNIGTTFKGAIDNIDLVIKSLKECGFSEDRFFIHCDAALYGLISPFLEQGSMLSFNKPIGSISVSGHKLLGSPIPCGVFMTRKKHIAILSSNIEYIDTLDNTISGSRNGHTPIFMWYTLSMKGHVGIKQDAHNCVEKAQYLEDRLRKEGISTLYNKRGMVVVFEKPLDQDFVKHWQLSCVQNLAHVVAMPHVTTKMLDDFVQDLVMRRKSWYGCGKGEPPCVAEEMGALNCACLIHGKGQNGHM